MLGSVQISGEDIGEIEVRDICDSLHKNSIRLLSLRGCRLHDQHFRRLMESLKDNHSLAHLNLNLGVVSSYERVKWLADALKVNTGVSALFIHGTKLGDEGMADLAPALQSHPRLQVLDLGDCNLGDHGISLVCGVLKPKESKADLLELTLTGNRLVSQSGWAQLAMVLSHGCRLQRLFLDYNDVGDFGAGVMAVALAASRHLQTLDLEGCGITDAGANLLCDALESYNSSMKELNLAENRVGAEILELIKECLNENAHSSIRVASPQR